MSANRTYKDIAELRRAVAEAAADIVEGNLAFLTEMEPLGSPIEERMLLGLAAACQRDNKQVELFTSQSQSLRWSLPDVNSWPVHEQIREFTDENNPPSPFRVGYTWSAEADNGVRIFTQCHIKKYRADFLVES